MARTRNLKPGFFKNEDLADLSPLARLLFAGLWCHADRDGRLEDRPRRLKTEILPYDDCDIVKLLDQLAGSPGQFIVRYEIDDQQFIAIPKFASHQNPHQNETASKIPDVAHTSTREAPDQHKSSTATRRRTKAVKPRATSTSAKHRSSTGVAPEQSGLNPSSLTLGSCSEVLEPSPGVLEPSKGLASAKPCRAKLDRSAEILQVFHHYRTHHPKACPKPNSRQKEWRRIKDRLAEGYSVEDLKAAIDGNHRSPLHCGENERGKDYHGLELIVRDANHVTQFMEIPENPAVLSEKERRGLRAAENFIRRAK